MARVSVIIVDNGCGSPQTSAITGSADTHTFTIHADTKPDFSNQWKPGRIIIPGRGVKQPTEVQYVHRVCDDSYQWWRERTHQHTHIDICVRTLPTSLLFFLLSPILCKCYNYDWLDFQQMILHNQLQTVLYETPTKLNPCSALILHAENLDWGEKGLTSFAMVKGKGRWEA